MSTTRQLGRVEIERWLYHTDQGDYGPVPTDKLLEAIAERKVDLSTQVRLLGQDKWSVAGEHALFRNYYEKCRVRWAAEDAEKAQAARELGFMQKERARRLRTRIILAVTAVVLAVGGWWMYKRSSIRGFGLAQAARLRTTPSLPVNVATAPAPANLPEVSERKFAVLAEPDSPISYDVAGVKVGGADTPQAVTRLDFGDDGEVAALDPSVLARVVDSAKGGVYACARQHATSNPSFTGTDVGFAVTSGRLARITVGAEVRKSPAFQACVKAALARVSVPSFAGAERGVTIPIRIAH